MRRVILVAVIGLFAAAGVVALGMWSKPAPPEERPEIPFPIGKETTIAVGPLDKNGYVDYEAALNERTGQGITPEKNANVLLWKALGPRPEGGIKGMPPEYFKALGIEEPPEQGDYLIDSTRFSMDRLKLQGDDRTRFDDQLERLSKRPWSAKEYPDVAAWLVANEKPLAVVAEAVKRPDYFNPHCTWRAEEKGPSSLLGCLLPNVQKCRSIAAILATRAMLKLNEGKFDEAWQDIYTCHRLGRLMSRGPSMIEFLVGVAIDAVASHTTVAYLERANLSTDQLRSRLKEWQSLPPTAPFADKLNLAERFMYLDCAQMIRRGGVGMLEGLSGGEKVEKPTEAELKGLARMDWDPALRDGNKWYDRMVSAARAKSRGEREKLFGEIEQDVKELKQKTVGDENSLKALIAAKTGDPGKEVALAINNVLIGLLLPATSKVMSAADRCEQVQRNLHIAFALALFHKDNGKYPAKLDELAPKYLATVPDDLFTGKPLVYRLEGKGYFFYSIGSYGKEGDLQFYGEFFPPVSYPSVRMPLPELKKK